MTYKRIFIILGTVFLISIGIFFFLSAKPAEKIACGDGICGFGETQENCCRDCGCYNLVCNTELNRCEAPIVTLTDDEVISILRNYLRTKGWEEDLINITDIKVTVFDNKAGKSATIQLKKQRFLGGVVLENRTAFIIDKFKLIDVWVY